MDTVFTSASHHDILVLVIQVAVLLFTARALGELAQRVGQPSVVGEILAGILLGPSLLSGLVPAIGEWIVPQTEVQGYLLELIGLLGVMFLLLITGLETDLELIRRQAKSAIGVALGGLVPPLLIGFLLGQYIPESLMVDPSKHLVFSLFLAIAMAISAIPVVAKVLMDLNLTRRDASQTILAAAMIDDTTGWILLSVVIGLAGGSSVTLAGVAQSILSVLGFMAISFTAGRWLVRHLLHFVQANVQSREKVMSLIVFLAFVWGAITQAIHIEAMLGAFVIGIIFGQMRSLGAEVVRKIESMTLGVFAPIFFAIAGLKVNIVSLLEPTLIFYTLLIIAVATFCKVAGVYAGARLIGGSDHWTALFFGAGLNARGSMGIIVANIGLTLGILTQDMFSIIVVMAVVTSVMAPAALRYALANMPTGQAEQDRLRREELSKDNLVANAYRVLLPARIRADGALSPIQTIEAQLLERLMTSADLNLTLMTVVGSNPNGTAQSFLDQLSQAFPETDLVKRVAVSKEPASAILEEVRRGYDLMVLGASEKQPGSDSLFTPVIDTLVRLAPCPTIVVHAPRLENGWKPQRIMIATNGSVASRRAAELGFRLAAAGQSEIMLLTVVEQSHQTTDLPNSQALEERQLSFARQMVDELREIGRLSGVEPVGQVVLGTAPETTIVDVARKEAVDLVVLGTSVKPGSQHLHLGPKVERVLSYAHCPVVVFNT